MDQLRVVAVPGIVDQQADLQFRVAAGQQLHHGVGVDDGGRIDRGHHQRQAGSANHLDDVVGNACRGVDEEEVELAAQRRDRFRHALALTRIELRQFAKA